MDESDFNESILPDDIVSSSAIDLSDVENDKFYYIITNSSDYLFGKVKELIGDDVYYTIVFNIYKQFDLDDATWKDARPKGRRVVFGPDEEYNMPNFYKEIEASLASKPPISNKTEYISKGSYGLTLRPALPNKKNNGSWEQYNKNITKLFYNKRDRNDAFKAIDDVVALTGNQRQKAYRYKYNYKKTNLPVGVLGHIEANGVLNKLKNTLYPMRMPDLGIDLNKINNPKVAEDLAKIPLTTIMQQIKKLLTQVGIFIKNKKIHGDIREYNIMIDTKTGELTIIDFDFFTNDVEFFRGKNTIKYQRPPENYLYCLTLKRRDYFPDANILLQQAKQESNKDFISSLGILDKDYKQLGIYLSDNNEFLFRKELDLTFKTYDDAFKILKKNYVEILEGVDVVNDEARTLYENSMLPTFDGFGLASSLLDLLVVMYTKYAFDPKYSMEEAISHMKSHLKKKVVHAAAAAGGAGAAAPVANISYEEYNNDELVQIYKTVQCLFYMVLMPMITLNIGDRTRPEVALGHIDKILLIHDKPEYLNKFHAITVSNMNLFRNASIGKNAPANAFVSHVSQPVKVLKSNSLPALPASNNSKGSKTSKGGKAPTKKHKVKKNKTYKKKSRK